MLKLFSLFQFENMRKVDEFSKSLKLNMESIGKETTDKVRLKKYNLNRMFYWLVRWNEKKVVRVKPSVLRM